MPEEYECGVCELTFVDEWVRDEHEADHFVKRSKFEPERRAGDKDDLTDAATLADLCIGPFPDLVINVTGDGFVVRERE